MLRRRGNSIETLLDGNMHSVGVSMEDVMLIQPVASRHVYQTLDVVNPRKTRAPQVRLVSGTFTALHNGFRQPSRWPSG